LSVVSNERHIDRDGLGDTGSREMLRDICPVSFGRQSLAELGQIVLTVRILNGGSEFRPVAGEMTAATE
jgi:hypothetical protein